MIGFCSKTEEQTTIKPTEKKPSGNQVSEDKAQANEKTKLLEKNKEIDGKDIENQKQANNIKPVYDCYY